MNLPDVPRARCFDRRSYSSGGSPITLKLVACSTQTGTTASSRLSASGGTTETWTLNPSARGGRGGATSAYNQLPSGRTLNPPGSSERNLSAYSGVSDRSSGPSLKRGLTSIADLLLARGEHFCRGGTYDAQ